MDKKMLSKKVAFITGGSTGIGAAAAKKMAAEGARVTLLARHLDDVEEVAGDIEAAGGEALPLTCDVSEEDSVMRALRETIDRFGQLDIVVANAGVNGRWAPVEELTLDDWQKTIGINLTGTFLTIKHAVPHLKKQGGGSVVVTASINGTRTFSLSGATAYATSKAGQLAMAKMLALELAPEGIRVNVVCPGQIATDIEESTERDDLSNIRYPVEYPQGKVPLTRGEAGDPDQVAELIAFLASDRAALITGTPVWIDGAQSLFMG